MVLPAPQLNEVEPTLLTGGARQGISDKPADRPSFLVASAGEPGDQAGKQVYGVLVHWGNRIEDRAFSLAQDGVTSQASPVGGVEPRRCSLFGGVEAVVAHSQQGICGKVPQQQRIAKAFYLYWSQSGDAVGRVGGGEALHQVIGYVREDAEIVVLGGRERR
ncbi:hypothetical protein AB0K15_25795 [Amycolatopsis sp. NPDC049253]|uniref:hypothetical protein n=1 Tax=Amycolatopsis sp. NPDC049253 TaxID=3155274 RepID=UPI003449F91E